MVQFVKNKEERKRLIELIAMIVTSVVLVILARLEGHLFQLSERLSEHKDFFNSVAYFGLINLNVILILFLSFLIFRNVVKLVVERRRGVIGSRLRTKLVISLVFFAVAPTALLFYVSSRFLTESFETWFSSRVEATIARTKEASSLIYKREERRLESLARIALQRIDVESSEPFFTLGAPRLNPRRLEGFESEYRLDSVKLFDSAGRLLWSSYGLSAEALAKESRHDFVITTIERFLANPGMTSRGAIKVEDGRDVVKGAAPFIDPSTGQLLGIVLTEERFETQIIRSVETILKEFSSLRPGAQLIRLSYNVLLVIMVLIIIFSATWLGFYVAKGIIGPIQSLADATRAVAVGNYDISLKSYGDDETGQLVSSFNRMIQDLRANRNQVKEFTEKLETTNVELEGRRRYMEVVLKNISAGVIAVDAWGVITSVNASAERLLQLDSGKAEGMPVVDALNPSLLETFWNPIIEALDAKGIYTKQIELESGDDTQLLIVDGSKIVDEHNEDLGYVLVFADASEQVKAQRVAAWREVARRIAHEIKNPITPIKLSAQRLLRRFSGQFIGDDRKVFGACIETIISEVDNLRDLVNEFSKFSRLPTIKPRKEDLNDIIREIYGLYSMSYSHIFFDTRGLQEDLPQVMVDREQISRVISNLVVNAEAAIGKRDGGVIAFNTKVVKGLSSVRIEVVDNGCGIPDKLKSRVLEPYFSTKSEGTGLGLAIVNQIVSDHGGYLRVSDNEPSGTVVAIEIPLIGDFVDDEPDA